MLRRDEKNKLHIKEVHDMGGGKGAVLGGALGAAVGLLAGPVGLAVGAGALIGGVAAKFVTVDCPTNDSRRLVNH